MTKQAGGGVSEHRRGGVLSLMPMAVFLFTLGRVLVAYAVEGV